MGMETPRSPCSRGNRWFHGSISRAEAELALLKEGNDEGLFLVRESSTVRGDFVLSVINEGEPAHFQIQRHGEDAFFSIEDGRIVHGLDTIIDLCLKEGASEGAVQLKRICPKDSPPVHVLGHGQSYLIHRAAKEGNYTVVAELVRCNYRGIDAKNAEGQTAVHLACLSNRIDILRVLIEGRASVNAVDEQNYTPLHYACMYNYPDCVRILLEAGANPQIRHRETGFVAIHEAANRGHTECVRFMLMHRAAPLPRTSRHETPADLARRNGFYQCARLLELYQSPPVNTRSENWFHGSISRQEAIFRLRRVAEEDALDSVFLIRKNSRKSGFFVLSHYVAKHCYHYEIGKRGQYYYIDEGPYMESLEHLVAHYMRWADGLPAPLTYPIPPPFALRTCDILNNNLLSPPPLPSRNVQRSPSPCRDRLTLTSNANANQVDTTSDEPCTASTAPLATYAVPRRSWTETYQSLDNIAAEDLVRCDEIGEGEFGSVFRGTYTLPESTGLKVSVAIKTLREDQVQSSRDEFLREARVMMALNHPCIARLLGICRGPPLMMVQELVPMGSLLSYLLDYPDKVSPDYDIRVWAAQIAQGMCYLEEKRFVHRDLAARNILLASRFQVKISDFGLSRAIGQGKEYYQASQGGRWPIKWYAPESVNFGTFSHASDAWSYAVTVWEMFSFGVQPYGDLPGVEVIRMVESGYRLPKPDVCPEETYAVMSRCWDYDPANRPTFEELTALFATAVEYTNVQTLLLCSPSVQV